MSGRLFPRLFSKSCSVRKKKKKGLREECERTNKFPFNSDIYSDSIFYVWSFLSSFLFEVAFSTEEEEEEEGVEGGM